MSEEQTPEVNEEVTPVEPDPNSPVEPLDIRLNFNSMLYVITEVVALFNGLIKEIKDKELLTDEEIQRVYATTTDRTELGRTHVAVFNRFMEYYVATKRSVLREDVQTVGDVSNVEVPSSEEVAPEEETPEEEN
jgi:hypothetical protein